MDCGLPGSSVYGISRARTLEWAALPSPGDLPHPGIEPASSVLAGGFFTTEPPGKPKYTIVRKKIKKKTVTKDNMGHLIMIEGSIQEESIYKTEYLQNRNRLTDFGKRTIVTEGETWG